VAEGPQGVRSVVAVGAGFFAIQVLGLGADIAIGSKVPLTVRLAYIAAFELFAGYVTARLAIRKPLTHAFVLSLIMLVTSGAIAVMTWDAALAWYHIITLVLIVPVILLGGKLGEMQVRRASG
jgi:hypothetical protein